MKRIYQLALSLAAMAFGQEFVQAPAQPVAQEKPIVAVPLFVNKTSGSGGGHNSPTGCEWQLPEISAEIATDATTSSIAAMGKWRVLSRSTPSLKAIDAEALFQGTGAVREAAASFTALKQMDAAYLLLGRINRFRVDETKGTAYGVRRWQVVTSVSMDLQLLDVNSGEIITGRQMSERVVMRVPEGVDTITAIFDWEEVLRAAVNKAVPAFMASVQSGPMPDVIQAAAPSVTIEVNSTPEGADVEFNGSYLGNTPCQITVPAVPGVLSITAPGYEPWMKRLTPNASMKVKPILQKIKQPAPAVAPQNGVPQNGAAPVEGGEIIIQ